MPALGLLPPGVLHARSAGYDVVLVAHVLAALVSLVVVALAAGNAVALRRSGSEPDALRRYYRAGPNWAGRILFLVPLLGALLVPLSQGDWSFADGWILVGLGVWLLAALAAEVVLWPAEQRLRAGVARGETTRALGPDCRRATLAAVLIGIALVAAAVVMVAKP